MKISALVITKDRPEFVPWWVWNLTKQTRPPDQVVVIDTSEKSCISGIHHLLWPYFPSNAQLYTAHCSSAWVTGQSRQRALEAADGDFICWFDDDDWYHPRKLESYEKALQNNTDCGVVQVMTHRLLLNTLTLISSSQSIWYRHLPYSCFPAKVAKQVEFKPQLRGEDEEWLEPVIDLIQRGGGHIIGLNEWDLGGFAIVHSKNTWQDEEKFELEKQLSGQKVGCSRLFGSVDNKEWQETVEQLEALQSRIPPVGDTKEKEK